MVYLLGGTQEEFGWKITVDSVGNVFVIGNTFSDDFPTLNAYNETLRGLNDAFVASFSTNGLLRWSTYLGGDDIDMGTGIVIDNEGNIYVTEQTASYNFPVTMNGTFGGNWNAFVTSFTNNGVLRWSRYLGGIDEDIAYGIAKDQSGDIYVVGHTNSIDFPNTFNKSLNGPDVFIVSLSSDGTIQWTNFFGGSDVDFGYSIALDSEDNIYVAGETVSLDLPVNNSSSLKGTVDAFVASFDKTGMLQWATYLGGSEDDTSDEITVTSKGVKVIGFTRSSDFPTQNAYDNKLDGSEDVFLVSFAINGTMEWFTFLGGAGSESGTGIATDKENNLYVTGVTGSIDFPLKNAHDDTNEGGNSVFDGFITKFRKVNNTMQTEMNATIIKEDSDPNEPSPQENTDVPSLRIIGLDANIPFIVPMGGMFVFSIKRQLKKQAEFDP